MRPGIEEAAAVYAAEPGTVTHDISEQEAHRVATRAPIPRIVSDLEQVLSRPLTAYIVGIKDPKTLARWATGDSPKIRHLDVERKLRSAYQVVTMLRPWDDDTTIRSWFIGTNPVLNYTSPADAIREGRHAEAMDAAHEFISNG
jgi:hypothetical protein